MTHPNTSLDNPNSISTIEELESNALKASEAYKNSVKELVVKRLGLIFGKLNNLDRFTELTIPHELTEDTLSKLKSDLAEHLPQIGTSQGDRLHYHLAQKLIGLCDVYKYERATDCEKIDNSSKQELKSLEELLQKQEDFVAASNQIIEVVKNLWLEIFNKEASSGVQKIQFQYGDLMTSRGESDLAIYLNKYQERKIVQLFLEYFIQVEQEKARENQIDLMSEKLLSVKVQKICESDNAPEGGGYEKAIRRRLKENGGVNTREIEADIEMKLQNGGINTF